MGGFFARREMPAQMQRDEALLRARLEGVNYGKAADACILFDRLSVHPDLITGQKISVAWRVMTIAEGICGHKHDAGSMEVKHVAQRAAVAGVLYAHFGWTLPQIARAMKQHHTTVLKGLQKLSLWLFGERLAMGSFAHRARLRRKRHLGLCAVKLCGWHVVPYGLAEAG